jgi:hypothetical protein
MLIDRIKADLLRFQVAIKASDSPALSTALTELETLLAAHRDELPPQLVHFLEGRSYAKALAWLGAENEFNRPSSPPGGCGGHA